ncbi:MAG: hypothetical protein NTY48_03740 [Candidatus Diapherotrites archaeon]|nr:hypothetical protein [Candidatus Diapherotrites archaeon]
MDVVYAQPLKELLQVSTYFKEDLVVLVSSEAQEKKVREAKLIPCFIVSESTPQKDLQLLSKKKKAVLGGDIKSNEFAVRIKADYLLSPCATKQLFDLGLAILRICLGLILLRGTSIGRIIWKLFVIVN